MDNIRGPTSTPDIRDAPDAVDAAPGRAPRVMDVGTTTSSGLKRSNSVSADDLRADSPCACAFHVIVDIFPEADERTLRARVDSLSHIGLPHASIVDTLSNYLGENDGDFPVGC